jgi:hypothetical protein
MYNIIDINVVCTKTAQGWMAVSMPYITLARVYVFMGFDDVVHA